MNLYKLSLKLKGFKIEKAINELKQLHSLSYEDYRILQDSKRNNIVQFHIENNPFYRDRVGSSKFDSFEELPIITKKDYQQPLEKLLSKGYTTQNCYISNTSGSTGIPLYFAKDKDSHAFSHAVILYCYEQWGINELSKQARFYGIPLSGKSKYIEFLKDFLMNRKRFPVFDLSEEKMTSFLRSFEKKKFQYLYGYTSAIVQFAKYLIKEQIVLKNICPSLKCCIVTSEVCTEEDKAIMSQAFSIPIVNEYGTSETSIIAFEYPNIGWKIIDENTYIEVVDNDGKNVPLGQEGRILITSLSNKAFPVIRYEIGDLGVLEEKNEVLLLKLLVGRVSDMIMLPSGKIAAGLTFYYVSRSLLENLGIIREFIIKQITIDTFVFDVVIDRDFSKQEIDFLHKQMDEYLETGLKLIINKVDKIKRPTSGKIKHFYSMINS